MKALMTKPGLGGTTAVALVVCSWCSPCCGQCEVAKLVDANGSAGDGFGTDVDVDGDVAIVGGFSSNSAHVYRFDGVDWSQESVLAVQEAVPNDLFGKAVAIRGGVAVVGANGDAENGGFAAGAAYVFRFDRRSSTWSREAKLLASDGEANDRFGWSVAVDGEWIVVGALMDDNANGTLAGSVYVFRHDGFRWFEVEKLVAAGGAPTGFLGMSVDADSNQIVAGAPGNLESAFVFRFDGVSWGQVARLSHPGGETSFLFGNSVSISGSAVVIGAPGDSEGGAAFVFRDCPGWTLEAELRASDRAAGDSFGYLSIDGDAVMVGAPGHRFGAGAAYVFRFNGATWAEDAKLLASDGQDVDNFGARIDLDGDVAAIGATGDDGFMGSAYIFAGVRGVDCNANGVADACDIDAGGSADVDGNRVPDECDCPWDVGGDGTVDTVDFLAVLAAWGPNPGHPADVNLDGSVDVLDFLALLGHWGPCPLYVDCDGNGVFDAIDLAQGASSDCNFNTVPDDCDIAAGASLDCNGNTIPDVCDLNACHSPDCNGNGIPDECDVSGGDSADANGNGVPDECEAAGDTCEDAVEITDGSVTFVTIGATTALPPVDCGAGFAMPIVNDVWFLYTSPCTGTVTFSLCNDADFDTLMAVYFTDSCPAPNQVNPTACSDDAAGCGQTSHVELFTVEGVPLLVRIGSPDGQGTATLTVSCDRGLQPSDG